MAEFDPKRLLITGGYDTTLYGAGVVIPGSGDTEKQKLTGARYNTPGAFFELKYDLLQNPWYVAPSLTFANNRWKEIEGGTVPGKQDFSDAELRFGPELGRGFFDGALTLYAKTDLNGLLAPRKFAKPEQNPFAAPSKEGADLGLQGTATGVNGTRALDYVGIGANVLFNADTAPFGVNFEVSGRRVGLVSDEEKNRKNGLHFQVGFTGSAALFTEGAKWIKGLANNNTPGLSPTPPDPMRAFDLDPPPPLDRDNSGTIAEYTRALPEVNNAAHATQLPDGYTVDIGEKRIPISKGSSGLENPEDVAHLVVKDPSGNVVGVLYDKASGKPLTPDAWISAAEKSKPKVDGIKKDFESFVADFQKIFGDKNPFITDHPTPTELADFKIHVANLKAAVTAYKDAKSRNDTAAMASAKTDIESARLATNADIDIMFLEEARADVKSLFPYVDSAGELIDPLEVASKVTKTETFRKALGLGRLSVAGHTDATVPGRKTKAEGIAYNKELSERRATSSTEILSISGIDAVPKGYGSTRLKDKANPNGAKNRRTELEILNPDDTTQSIGVVAQGLSTQAATMGVDPVSYETFAEIIKVGDADAESKISLIPIKLEVDPSTKAVSEFKGTETKIEDEDLKYKKKYDATKKAYDKEKAKRDAEIDDFDSKHGTTSPKEPSDEIDLGTTGGTSRLGG